MSTTTVERAPGTTRELLMARFLEALRSGEYTQRYGALHGSGGSHCALGVADVLFGESKGMWALETQLADQMGLLTPLTAGERAELEGLGIGFVDITAPKRQTAIAQLNDKVRLSFAEIADYVERFGWDRG
jgi:hypothetical protein